MARPQPPFGPSGTGAPATGRRWPGRRWTGTLVISGFVLASAVLAGCADPTGDIDAAGHNGYDADTCEQAKAFALDIQYGTVYPASVGNRIRDLSHDAAKASHQEVRQAATALIAGYQAGNKQGVTTATAALVKVCQM